MVNYSVMRYSVIILIVGSLFSFFPQVANAKLLPQAKKAGVAVKRYSGSGITVSPRLNRAKSSLSVSFGNLGAANSVSYSLVYTTNGHEEGAGGSVNPKEGTSATRELLFGTCSSGVCRLHGGITNARLEVTTELKTGKKTLKRFRIRV